MICYTVLLYTPTAFLIVACLAYIHCVSKKVPTFKLFVILTNVNRFSKFLHCLKAYEICYNIHTTALLTPCFVQLFSGNLSVDLFTVYLFKYNFLIKILSSSLNTMLFVDKHCSDVCSDEFLVPQICKRTVTFKILFAISMEKYFIF